MSVTIVAAEAEARLDWLALTRALEDGHAATARRSGIRSSTAGGDTLLSRAAWIDGMGLLVKSATVFPGNAARGTPSINGGVSLFSDRDGTLEAILDFHLVTKWKTAGDSLLAALKLAPKDTRTILIVGAGTVAQSLREAYGAAFPDARFLVWNRSKDHAMRLASWFPDTEVVDDLAAAVHAADIITCATMTTTPVIRGEWLRPGQHLDLIGAYRPTCARPMTRSCGAGGCSSMRGTRPSGISARS
jgi:ornithine cyclodeaminase/alanine dehydrogenase-like protein (mu-crystallin family)